MTDYAVLHYQTLSARALPPKQATPGSIGLDLFSPISIAIPAYQKVCVPTDLILVPTAGHYLRLASKSGLVVKHNIVVEAGVIDPDYRGNVTVVLRNQGQVGYFLKSGWPMAQVIMEKAVVPEVVQAQILDQTERGAQGFGSTHPK